MACLFKILLKHYYIYQVCLLCTVEVNKKKVLFSEKARKTGIAPKTSIFSRLGKEVTTTTKSPSGPTITITGLGDLTLPESSTSQVCTQHMSLIVRKPAFYTPRKLCLWVGILFSRCPSVLPTVCVCVCP